MYSDLFDALGGGGGMGNAAGSSSTRQEPPPLMSFKAGKMDMQLKDDGSSYQCTPDTRRAQVNLKYNSDDNLVWEWFDRREKSVTDTIAVTSPVALKKADMPVPTSTDPDDTPNTEVYYWKLDNEWKMIWLQDKEIEEGLIDKINAILKHPKKPSEAPAPAEGAAVAPSPGDASTSTVSTTTRQVDALSNILENLGMPQGGESGGGAATAASARAETSTAAAGTGTLTLADLQGAMAGLQQQQDAAPMVNLQDIVTPEAISELLAQDDIRNRLLQELPEEQRSPEFLEENLRSPQMQSTLRSLSAALLPDDNGSLEGYHSVIANFQLDAADGQRALTETNNPIQAFLECVIASVKKEKEGEESKDEEMKD